MKWSQKQDIGNYAMFQDITMNQKKKDLVNCFSDFKSEVFKPCCPAVQQRAKMSLVYNCLSCRYLGNRVNIFMRHLFTDTIRFIKLPLKE